MGKVRTKTVKRAARKVVENHFPKLSSDFYVNKRVVLDNTVGTSKKLKNKIAGYATHMMKRLARGPVRGISLKLQEEQREQRLDFVPEIPWIQQKVQDGIQVNTLTLRMLKRMETGVPRAVRVEREEQPPTTKRAGGKGASAGGGGGGLSGGGNRTSALAPAGGRGGFGRGGISGGRGGGLTRGRGGFSRGGLGRGGSGGMRGAGLAGGRGAGKR